MDKLAKLKWQCRRGTLELDIMLRRYLDRCYIDASKIEQQAFVELLTLEDTELLKYLMAGHIPEQQTRADLVRKIRSLIPLI